MSAVDSAGEFMAEQSAKWFWKADKINDAGIERGRGRVAGLEECDEDYSHSAGHIRDGPVCIEQWRARGRYTAGDNARYEK